MAAEQAKDRGNKAFSAGRHRDAVACFTEAIALHERASASGDDAALGKLHVYYSNRSASHLKLGDGASALRDADQCIALQRDFAKGYSRRGAALYLLGRFADAFRAYKDGLAIDPGNAALRDGLQSVQQRMAAPATATPSTSGGAYRTATSASSVANKTLRQFVAGDKAALFQTLQFAMRALLLLTFVSYWLPLLLSSALAFSSFFKVALFNYASYLMFTHGRPQWNAAYGQRLVLDPTVQSFFYCLVFWVSAPYGLAMVPVFLLEMVHFFAYASNLLAVLKLADAPFAVLVTSRALVPLAATLISDSTFPALPTQSKWAKLYHRMPQVAANVEVAIGVSLIVELLMPSRNFLLVMLYWQLLRVRYMISPPLQDAFRSLDATVLTLTTHPRCPALVAAGYTKLRALAKGMTEIQQPQAGGAGARPKCTVM